MILKLECGGDSLNLNDGTIYKTANDFTIPTSSYNMQLSKRSSASRFAGSYGYQRVAHDRNLVFNVNILGTTTAETHHNLNRLVSFIESAGTGETKTFLLYRADDAYTYEPLWGQHGAFLRYEIKSASTRLWENYSRGDIRKRAIRVELNLVIAPVAIINKQRVCSGVGGVVEDFPGVDNGMSRGVIVPEATTNKMLNPVFGDVGAYNTGWTTGSSLNAERINDRRFILFGLYSVKIYSGATSNNTYTQSITAGNTNSHTLSCYTKLPDSGVISTTQVDLYHGAAKTTVYTAVGDGWYRLTSTFAATAAATATGVVVKSGYTVYIDGIQFEEKAYVTPLAYGDQLGCAFSGTIHESSTVRTAARLKLGFEKNTMLCGQGTIRLVLKMTYANTAGPATKQYFQTDGAALKLGLSYATATQKWTLTDGTNSAVTAATHTWAAGAVIIIHCVWGIAGGIGLYINGASHITNATHTPFTIPTYLYIGCSTTATNQPNDTLMGCAIFDRVMTATEIDNDYDEIVEWVSQSTYGQRLETIPWLWTKDGDDIVDNCDANIGAAIKDHWCAVGGVPGSAPGEIEAWLAMSTSLATTNKISFSRLAIDRALITDMLTFLFHDLSGTADATYSVGDAYDGTTLSVAPTINEIGLSAPTMLGLFAVIMAGQEAYTLVRGAASAAANVRIRARAVYTSLAINGEYTSCALQAGVITGYRLFVINPISFPGRDKIFSDIADINSIQMELRLQCTIATGTPDTYIDYFVFFPRPALFVDGSVGGTTDLIMRGKTVGLLLHSGSYAPGETYPAYGDAIDVEPEQINIIQSIAGNYDANPAITYTLTYTRLYITPRYTLV